MGDGGGRAVGRGFFSIKKKKKKGASGNVFILRQENNLQKFKSKKQWRRHMGADCRRSFPLPGETLPLTAGK